MTREEIKNLKAGDFLTTMYGNIILIEHTEVTEKSVCVYFYFDYDKEIGISMNEWLNGFYGPKFDNENFYRPSTEDEKKFFLEELQEYGYELEEFYGKITPKQTKEEFCRHHSKKISIPSNVDEVAKECAIEVFPEKRMAASAGGSVYTYDMHEGLRRGFEKGFKAGVKFGLNAQKGE